MQDSISVKQVREMNRELDRLIDKSLQAYDKRLAALEGLAEAVGDEQFVADSNVFTAFDAAFAEQPKGAERRESPQDRERRSGEILALLYQLLDPESSDPHAPEPDPELPVATGADRTEGREAIASLLREEIEAVNQARQKDRDSRAPYFRDSAIPPTAQRGAAVFKMEETSFRQIAKFTDLLLRLKAKEEAAAGDSKNRETKEGPTMLLITKDRFWESTMLMKTHEL